MGVFTDGGIYYNEEGEFAKSLICEMAWAWKF
jgi:3-deoxy-D-manno-octulosonate 8-phosphate phosphatase KdsC-like HAD superfamily phosphatase